MAGIGPEDRRPRRTGTRPRSSAEAGFFLGRGDERVRPGRGKVAVGAPGAETRPPSSTKVEVHAKAEILGAYACETSAYAKLSDPGRRRRRRTRTPWPWLLGKKVSHGCVRLHNDDVRWLRTRMPDGTPIKIVR